MKTRTQVLADRAAMLALAALLGACVQTTPQYDSRFGDSLRVSLASQVAKPEAVRNADPVAGIDGRAARAAQERYESSFKAPPPPQPVMLLSTGGVR
ncbi:MAG: hypothetical protein WA191_11890 [Telluria sp.]|nr:hypothetical protein [Telluria sp.]